MPIHFQEIMSEKYWYIEFAKEKNRYGLTLGGILVIYYKQYVSSLNCIFTR